MTPEAQTLVSAASPLLLSACLFFLKGMANDVKATAATTSAHSTLIAVMQAQVENLKSEVGALRMKNDDLVGFLQSQGFKKREG